MKRFKYFLRTFFIVFLLIFTINTNAEETNLLKSMDSVDISLLTCGPGKEIYSMFGHSALRVNDKIHHQDLAFNYGMFSFDQPYFISRFILGLTDYQLGIQTMSDFMEEYYPEIAKKASGTFNDNEDLQKENYEMFRSKYMYFDANDGKAGLKGFWKIRKDMWKKDDDGNLVPKTPEELKTK